MRNLLLVSLIPVVGAVLGAISCSSVSCGEGTVLEGSSCVLAGGAGGEGALDVEFDGVKAAAPASATSLLAAWIPSERDDVTYRVFVATSEDDFNYSTPQAEAPAGSSTIVVTGLESEATYFVSVRAVVGDRVIENDAVAEVTLADDVERPAFAGVESAESFPGAGVELTWAAATDDLTPEGALVYYVYAGTNEDDLDLRNPVGVSWPGVTSTVVTMPEADADYVFVVRAGDAAGNLDDNEKLAEAASGPDESAPRFSGCKSASARTASSLAVTWDAALDDITPPEAIRYHVYASEDPDDFNLEAPDAIVTGELSGIVPGLDRATSYYVLCRAVDAGDNEDENERLQRATTKADGEPPVFAGDVAVVTIGTETVELTWGEASDDQSDEDDIVFDVFLAEESDGFDLEGEAFATSSPGASGMTVEGLDSNTNYFLVITARDEGDNRSEPSDESAFTTYVSFTGDVLGIFDSKGCASSGCHVGGTPQAGLQLDPQPVLDLDKVVGQRAYEALVDVDASTPLGSGFKRVLAGDPSNSHLIHRLKGTGPVTDIGQRMPADGNVLSATQISVVELWITQGAEFN